MPLYPTAPPDVQGLRLTHIRDSIDEIKSEVETRNALGKRYHHVYNGFKYATVSLNALSASASAVTVGCLASGVDVVAAVPLGAVSLCVAGILAGMDLNKAFLAKKSEKHASLHRLADSHLVTMLTSHSRVLEDGDVTDAEFSHINQQLTAWSVERKQVRAWREEKKRAK